MESSPVVDTSRSPYAVLKPAGLNEVTLRPGFWRERCDTNSEATIHHLYQLAADAGAGHAVANLKIAAGLETGEYAGTNWQDEWVYKWIEGAVVTWASTRDPTLDRQMDELIEIIGRAQCADGYLASQVICRGWERYQYPQRHECYVMGHLLTAAALHHRLTGKRTFLEIAIRCGIHLHEQFRGMNPRMAHFPYNPSLIMGAVELYRETRDPRFLELADTIVSLRGHFGRDRHNPRLPEGDQCQDRIPLRLEDSVVGHAVFSGYLYAGAADVYLETGDGSLLRALERLHEDFVGRKMYVTGGACAMDRGVNVRPYRFYAGPTGESYVESPLYDADIVSEAAGPAYWLPNGMAYNETCAQIAVMMWAWRMLLATGKARYAELMERELYNGILVGADLAGRHFSYSNTLRSHGPDHEPRDHPVAERFNPGRERCICCPTNYFRTIAEIRGYLYTVEEGSLRLHHYAASEMVGRGWSVVQETGFPWDGEIHLSLRQTPPGRSSIQLRIPEWATGATLEVNGEPHRGPLEAGTYTTLQRAWTAGDHLTLRLPLRARMITAHPKVEETRNQVAILRGPLVYCLEQPDVAAGAPVRNLHVPAGAVFNPVDFEMGGVRLVALETTLVEIAPPNWNSALYLELDRSARRNVQVRLIPYFAWANRGVQSMSVWLPLG